MARECRHAWGSVHPGTEVLVGGPLARDDDSPEYVLRSDDGASMASDDAEMASGDEEVAVKAAPPQPRPLCSAPAVSTSSSSVSVSPAKVSGPVSVSTSPSSASVSPALVSTVSTPSTPASHEVPSSVPTVPVSSAVTSDSEPVTSVAPSSVPVLRSSVVVHRDKIDSYLLSALGDFSRDDVIRVSPARVTDFVSHVIQKNGLSVDSHQYMARFVYQVQRKFCVQVQTGKKPMKPAPAKNARFRLLAGRPARVL